MDPSVDKVNILNEKTYRDILNFINNYKGLEIECELELPKQFPHIDEKTLRSILGTENTNKIKCSFHKFSMKSRQLLRQYEGAAMENPKDFHILIRIAHNYKMPPVFISRIILYEKYKSLPRTKLNDMVKFPNLIPDDCLSGNVRMCLCYDKQEGPLCDFIKRCIGEEYEIKAKQLATEAGMLFVDEEDLRRVGFDKTPDLKLALPCLYEGFIVNWIESKALFGDVKTHKRYVQKQLSSYVNRFGSGIVIYWFGYVESISHLTENNGSLMILNKFPEIEKLEFLKI